MDKRTIIVLLVGLTLASVHLVEAQQPAKIPRIGYLGITSPSANEVRIEAFRQGLRQLDELREAALLTATDSQRQEIFECLRAAYGDEFKLYSRLWHTNSPLTEDTEGDEFEVTGANISALGYVMNGFLQGCVS